MKLQKVMTVAEWIANEEKEARCNVNAQRYWRNEVRRAVERGEPEPIAIAYPLDALRDESLPE